MKIWIVGVSDCEGNSVRCICSTKDIAERELFRARDELIAGWKRMDKFTQKSMKEFCKKNNKRVQIDMMYKKMITALSGNDYKKWDNYPHEIPYLYETELLED